MDYRKLIKEEIAKLHTAKGVKINPKLDSDLGEAIVDSICRRVVKNCRIANVSRSLRDCKEEWASNYDKTWEDVQKDFEYGNGLAKMWDFEQVMDMVAELYKKQ